MVHQTHEVTAEEAALIDLYLPFYKSLASGQRQPATPAQFHFVEVCRGEAKPNTLHEMAFLKYAIKLATSPSDDLTCAEVPQSASSLAEPRSSTQGGATGATTPATSVGASPSTEASPACSTSVIRAAYANEQELPEIKYLVYAVNRFRTKNPSTSGWACTERVRVVLEGMLGKEPSEELVQEVSKAVEADETFFEGFEPADNERHPWSTGGGRRIVRKPEIFGG